MKKNTKQAAGIFAARNDACDYGHLHYLRWIYLQ